MEDEDEEGFELAPLRIADSKEEEEEEEEDDDDG